MKKGLAFSLVASGLCAWYWKVYHMDYRQKKTKEYYATYDPVKEFERMRDMGLFQWAKPKPGAKPIYNFHEMEYVSIIVCYVKHKRYSACSFPLTQLFPCPVFLPILP